MPQRLPQQWQLLHPFFVERTRRPTPCRLMPLGLSHEWWLLPGEQQFVKSSHRQKRQLPVWVSHQRRLLFTQLTIEMLLQLAGRLVINQMFGQMTV